MTDLEIDRKLALAIGHKPEDIFVYFDVLVEVNDHEEGEWREFSHLDWNVIGPIGARYGYFQQRVGDESVGTAWRCDYGDDEDIPQRAIAMAVINSKTALL